MKKTTLLLFIAVTLVFTACGEDTKAVEAAAKAKAERVVELDKMTANKIASKAAEKAEVAQMRAEAKAAKAKAEKEAAEAAKRKAEAEAKAIAEEVAKKEAEAKAAVAEAEKKLKETNTTDASIIEAANKEIKVTH